MIYEVYKPVLHIKVRFNENGSSQMWSAPGTANIIEGASRFQRKLLRLRKKLWRWSFELTCNSHPPYWANWIHGKINNWKVV